MKYKVLSDNFVFCGDRTGLKSLAVKLWNDFAIRLV